MGVGGVAGDGQHLGPGPLQAARHLRQDRARPGERIVAVGHLGVDVDDDPDVVLVLLGRGQGLQLGQEVEGGGGTHAAEDAKDAAHSRCPSRTEA